ncbi:interferon alpha/beta receptor 2-like isoform X2 [Rana temporaria]|uniref:interferon alpha/beta receptor 2-like isoform X2 n=1 Tax=Rana temporaria TaxID=8407 RepID=UPI001AAD507A|nr:interferon alpha/beta receptor 2-like isoform X2 [Rana temporaria]
MQNPTRNMGPEILITAGVSAVLQPPRNLQFSSNNFQHILTWEDPNNESAVYYKVEYSKNYRELVPTRDCANISIPRCDLTKDFTDIFGNYAAQIQIFTHNDSSVPVFSPSLNPISDTWLGPPIVDVISDDNGLQVSIRPPVSHLWSENEQRNVTMLSDNVYPLLLYTIQWVKDSAQASIQETETGNGIYTELIPDSVGCSNYCVSVNASTDLNDHSVASPMKCILTKPPRVGCDGRVYWMVVIFVVVILAVGLALFTNFFYQAGGICRKQIFTPEVLESFPWVKSFLDDSNELSPLVYIPMEVIRTESKQEQMMEQGMGTNMSIRTNNGIKV